jgi:hypothetical protein
MASFWNDSSVEPKRQFRWVFSLANHFQSGWMIKSVDKPVATVGAAEHKYFGHTFKYPGNVTWNDINVVLVDPVQPDSVNSLATILRQVGYNPPTSRTATLETISKKKSTTSLGNVFIRQLNAEGLAIEEWKLKNPIIKSADFGGGLSYDNEGLIEVKITLAYDWAQLTKSSAGGTVVTVNRVGPNGTRYWVDGTR